MTTRTFDPAPATTVIAADATTVRSSSSWASVVWVLICATSAGAALGWLGVHLSQDEHPQWLLARICGLAAIVLMTALVSLGLALAHPRGTTFRRIPRERLIKTHVGLATFTGVFTVLHVVVLATDQHSGVGWLGALLPLGADYRPLPVTLGWIALYGGLAAGLTARFAGRVGRLWWPIHRVAIVTYGAAWLHGVLAGTDSAALTMFYAASLFVVLSLAVSRYAAEPVRIPGGQR